MMIGRSSSSSIMMRLASRILRERLSMTGKFVTTTPSVFLAPLFSGLFSAPLLQPLPLSPTGVPTPILPDAENQQQHILFAVPKSKISRSRKRMKTTRQKRIPLKKNIVFDPRTGEVTLKHKLPYNWKDYLPKID